MFGTFWIVWTFLGLAVATWLFRWALRTGQFADSRRAGLLPLEGAAPQPVTPRSGGLHLAVLVGLAVVGILLTSAVVVIALVSG